MQKERSTNTLPLSFLIKRKEALEAYMVVNFRARGISRGARKLARTPILNLKKKREKRSTNTDVDVVILLSCF